MQKNTEKKNEHFRTYIHNILKEKKKNHKKRI